MKPVIILVLASAAAVAAEPGRESFTDLRLALGVASPITDAEAAGVVYETDPAIGPRLGVQWVRGPATGETVLSLGIEFAYDDHRGTVSRATGAQTVYGTGDTLLRTATVGLLPKLILRPDYGDPFDWGVGTMQIEFGLVLAGGVGWGRIGGSPPSDPCIALRYGVRLDLVWTDPDSRWQGGVTLGWESVTAAPDLADDASISGSGICGGLILGRRM